MHTDLPDPVVPAINRCGIFDKSNVLISPIVVLPIANVNNESALANSWLFTIDLKSSKKITRSVISNWVNFNQNYI